MVSAAKLDLNVVRIASAASVALVASEFAAFAFAASDVAAFAFAASEFAACLASAVVVLSAVLTGLVA